MLSPNNNKHSLPHLIKPHPSVKILKSSKTRTRATIAMLATLPNELLLMAGAYCDAKNLHSLLLTNRRFNSLFTPLLHKIAPEDKGHFTALTWAASRGHLPLIKLLIEQGVDLERHDGFGISALSWAVMDGNEEVVRALIEAGADIHARGKHSMRPIDCARQLFPGYSRTDISSWDKSHYRGPWNGSVWRGVPYRERGGAITKLLLEMGADAPVPATPPPPPVVRCPRLRRLLCIRL